MTLYHVHIFREMRLYFPSIEADSPEAAAQAAAGRPTDEAAYSEDCDGENLAALVDVAGDEDYAQSMTIDFEGERLRKEAPRLLSALQQVLTFATNRDVPPEAAVNAVLSIAECTLAGIHGKTEAEPDAKARAAIARAAGGSPPDPRKPIFIEVRGGIVQDVRNVPPGYDYEVIDFDDLNAQAEASAGRTA